MKFARTVIKEPSGCLIPARLNLSTGEIKPYAYKKRQDILTPRPRLKNGSEIDLSPLHWQLIMSPNHVLAPTIKQGRKARNNSSGLYLQEFEDKACAIDTIPPLDAILDGVSRLDTGNSKPVSQALLFHLMKHLETIDTFSIMSLTGYSERYSRKLAALLRVAVNAFESETEN